MTKERFLRPHILAVLILFWAVAAQGAEIKTRQKTIVIDPGHGGSDPGLTTPSGLRENRIALELAQMTAADLSGDFNTKLTRSPGSSTPALSSPEQRAALATLNRADLFLSIHLHHAPRNTAFVFYFDPSGTPSPDPWQIRSLKAQTLSQKLAQTMADRLKATLPISAAVFKAPVEHLEGISCPAVLIEPLAISQIPGTREKRKTFLQPHAKAMAQAVRNFFKIQN